MDFDYYEKEGRAAYADFAEAVAAILTAAIRAEKGFRLQQVTHRAKLPASLKKKLADRQVSDTQTLEAEIKDLAGCRVIFYTNSDVSRFIQSGIVHENFEIVDAKIHHPRQGSQDASELYISNHFVVKLRIERAALPEYAQFAGMRCEVQIQTILNHAWAEMAHDTIYKEPDHGDFGTRVIDGIKERLRKVSEKYLVPAGYEFQRIASDFDRLMAGKALFDQNALDLIVDAPDNNARADALHNFSEGVLPLYDDPQQEYPHIVEQLLIAAERSVAVQPIDIETPYGLLPAKTASDILKGIVAILGPYRYLDVETTFDALCELYSRFTAEEDQQALIEVGKALAKHDLRVWKDYGPAVQSLLLDRMETLDNSQHRGTRELLLAVLGEILGVEVTGTTSDSSTITWHQGVVVVSDELRAIRRRAMELLKHQYAISEDAGGRYQVLRGLQSATRLPMRGHGNDLIQLVLENADQVIVFHTEKLSDLGFDQQQSAEYWVNNLYRTFGNLPEAMRSDQGLLAAAESMQRSALAFRDAANASADFAIYKVLVGFNSVYPPAWGSDRFQHEQAEQYRNLQVEGYLNGIDAANADEWFERVTQFSQTKSDDLATFPVFGDFLEQWAVKQPEFFLARINRLEDSLARFLPRILAGLMRSTEAATAYSTMGAWLDAGLHIHHVAWYLRGADTVGLPFLRRYIGVMLRRALVSALRFADAHAMCNVLIAAATQYATNPTPLIRGVFLKALSWLSSDRNFNWLQIPWFSWRENDLIRSLDEAGATKVLSALVPFPFLEYASEDIVAALAGRWPTLVVRFLGDRQAFAKADGAPPEYDAVPFSAHALQDPLAAAPDLLLAEAQSWFDADPSLFTYEGGRLIASIFPNLVGVEGLLQSLIDTGEDGSLHFVIGVLSAYEGKPCIDTFVHAMLAKIAVDNPLFGDMRSVYREAGVVSGEFGFVDLYVARKARVEPWLRDEHISVRTFAEQLTREFDQRIAAETRSAEASIAMRKLQFGEDLGDKNSGGKKAGDPK